MATIPPITGNAGTQNAKSHRPIPSGDHWSPLPHAGVSTDRLIFRNIRDTLYAGEHSSAYEKNEKLPTDS